MFEITMDAGTGITPTNTNQAIFAARECAKRGLRLEIFVSNQPGYILVQYKQCNVITLGHPSQDMELMAAAIRSGI